MPKGYDPDGPRADPLRHGGLFAGMEEPIPDAVGTADFATWTAERMAPLHRRLVSHVACA